MTSYSIPYVTTRTNQGERTVDVYSRLLSDRVVYLGTPIDDGVANAVIAQLIHLESDSPEQPINLYLNSPGGSISATLAIYDAMQYIQCDVETTCVGQAAATASMIARTGSRLSFNDAWLTISLAEIGMICSTSTSWLALSVWPVETRSTMASASPVSGASSIEP